MFETRAIQGFWWCLYGLLTDCNHTKYQQLLYIIIVASLWSIWRISKLEAWFEFSQNFLAENARWCLAMRWTLNSAPNNGTVPSPCAVYRSWQLWALMVQSGSTGRSFPLLWWYHTVASLREAPKVVMAQVQVPVHSSWVYVQLTSSKFVHKENKRKNYHLQLICTIDIDQTAQQEIANMDTHRAMLLHFRKNYSWDP